MPDPHAAPKFAFTAGLVAAGIAMGVFLVGTYGWNTIKTAITPQPEPFTELYIENHLELPKTHHTNQPLRFGFTIHNLEYRPMAYSVLVRAESQAVAEGASAASASTSAVLLEQQINLEHDGTQTLNVEVSAETLQTLEAGRTRFEVLLTELDQNIFFWVNLTNDLTATSSAAASGGAAATAGARPVLEPVVQP